jgi:lipopolysaccharide export system permease protein
MRVGAEWFQSNCARGGVGQSKARSEVGALLALLSGAGVPRGRRSLNLIDRHLLREWLHIFVLVLGAVLGLLLMQAMYDDFRDVLRDGASAGEIALYYAVKLPSYLSVVLPLALLMSLLYALGQLHRNNEITALRAAGLGLLRITRSLWVAGVVLCGVTWYLNASVIPWSVEEARAIRESISFRQEARGATMERVGVRTGVAFDNQREGRMWFFNRYSQFTRRGYGATVVELDAARREKTRLLAKEAWLDVARGGWVFRDGRELWLDPATGEVTRTVAFVEKIVPRFKEDPALMQVFDVKPGDLSFHELRRIIDYFSVEENPKVTAYAVRYYGLLADTLGPLIVLAIAIPFAVAGVRVNPVVGVSKSIGLFLIYFVLLRVSTALGSKEILPAIWAALLPSVAMLGVGLGFVLRAR